MMKKKEKNMKRNNEELEKTFLFNMSHELRTPLNVIIGMCDIAKLHLEDTERVKDCLEKINTAGDHLTRLVDNVMDITKMRWKTKEEIVKEQEFKIDDMINELEMMLEPMASRHSIITDISAKDVINRCVIGDYGHVMQVLINISANAVKYTPDGGFVKISVREKPNEDPGSITYIFNCRDNGIGMSEDFLKRIYKPFERADDIMVRQVEGHGLGMAIVRSIVDMLNGEIKIQSEEGIGTEIEVCFRFKVGSIKNKVDDINRFKKKELKKLQEKKIVLLAEDKKFNREVLVTYLEEIGFTVDTAENGEEVVDMFMESEEGLYKAIFMDVRMPIIDGCQATIMIRNLNRSDNNIPIIAMTANAFESEKERAINSGMDYFLTKPLKMERLLEFLDEVGAFYNS